MKKNLAYILAGILVLTVSYLAAFFILGWLAPHHPAINRFYSDKFYSLRSIMESNHLNSMERHDGTLTVDASGNHRIMKGKGMGIGFLVPESLIEVIAQIPSGSEVEAYLGKRLDRDSIGYYHNEIRSIKIK